MSRTSREPGSGVQRPKLAAVAWPEEVERIYWQAMEMRPNFPGASLIRIRSDWREREPLRGPAATLFREHLAGAQTVLDVGAGDRYWAKVLKRLGISARYESGGYRAPACP